MRRATIVVAALAVVSAACGGGSGSSALPEVGGGSTVAATIGDAASTTTEPATPQTALEGTHHYDLEVVDGTCTLGDDAPQRTVTLAFVDGGVEVDVDEHSFVMQQVSDTAYRRDGDTETGRATLEFRLSFGGFEAHIWEPGVDPDAEPSCAHTVYTLAGTSAPGAPVPGTAGPADATFLTLDLGVLVSERFGVVAAGQVIAVAGPGAPDTTIDDVAAALGATEVGRLWDAGVVLLQLPTDTEIGLAEALAAAAAFDGVTVAPNPMAQMRSADRSCSATDSDLYDGAASAAYRAIGLDAAHQMIAGSGVPVQMPTMGVVDSSLFAGSDEFTGEGAAAIRAARADAVAYEHGQMTPVTLEHFGRSATSHGTEVVSVLAGRHDNGGVNGVLGPLTSSSEIVHASVYQDTGSIYWVEGDEWREIAGDDPVLLDDEHLLAVGGVGQEDYAGAQGGYAGPRVYGSAGLMTTLLAIEQVVRDGATVVNLSMGQDGADPLVAEVGRAYLRSLARRYPEVIVVAAAPNHEVGLDGRNDWFAGLDEPNVVTVTGLDTGGARWDLDGDGPGSEYDWGSGYAAGGEVTISAVNGLPLRGDGSDRNRHGSDFSNGNSYAAPQVTGAISMLRGLDPTLTPAELKDYLVRSAATTWTLDGASTPVDPAVGPLMRVDEAVYLVLTERLGIDLSREELLRRGSIEISAAEVADLAYEVAVTLAWVGPGGTFVEFESSGPGTFYGDAQGFDAAGTAVWEYTFAQDGQRARVVATRRDTGMCAAATIGGDAVPLAGTYIGAVTVTAQGDGVIGEIPFTAIVGDDLSFSGTVDGSVTATLSGVEVTYTLVGGCDGAVTAGGALACEGDYTATAASAGSAAPPSSGGWTGEGSIAGGALTGTITTAETSIEVAATRTG
ncbi:MAG: S8 family peptidase [Actinobacteria bacterium]|nr:S8 family peptidase [Actinomycetota bacterium]